MVDCFIRLVVHEYPRPLKLECLGHVTVNEKREVFIHPDVPHELLIGERIIRNVGNIGLSGNLIRFDGVLMDSRFVTCDVEVL